VFRAGIQQLCVLDFAPGLGGFEIMLEPTERSLPKAARDGQAAPP